MTMMWRGGTCSTSTQGIGPSVIVFHTLLSAIDDTGTCKQRKLHNLGNVVLLLLLPVTVSGFCKGRHFAFFSHKLDASTLAHLATFWIPYEPLRYLASISNVLSTYAPICPHLYWCSEHHISIMVLRNSSNKCPSRFTAALFTISILHYEVSVSKLSQLYGRVT